MADTLATSVFGLKRRLPMPVSRKQQISKIAYFHTRADKCSESAKIEYMQVLLQQLLQPFPDVPCDLFHYLFPPSSPFICLGSTTFGTLFPVERSVHRSTGSTALSHPNHPPTSLTTCLKVRPCRPSPSKSTTRLHCSSIPFFCRTPCHGAGSKDSYLCQEHRQCIPAKRRYKTR